MYPQDELKLRKNVIEEKTPNVREELMGYYAHCTATDKAIGDLLDQIKELGLYDNSIIVFTSDHGEMMGSHGIHPKDKQHAYDEAVKVPFLIRYPGIGESEGKEIFTPLNTTDILPTMLSMANVDVPDCIEGENLSSIIRNPESQTDRAVLFMSVKPFTLTPTPEYRAIRTKQYTYVKTPDKASMLFDNISDPYQMDNLIDQPEYQELQSNLDLLLHEKLRAIGDEDFKHSQYYLDKWGYDYQGRGSVPYNSTPGKMTRVYTPKIQN